VLYLVVDNILDPEGEETQEFYILAYGYAGQLPVLRETESDDAVSVSGSLLRQLSFLRSAASPDAAAFLTAVDTNHK